MLRPLYLAFLIFILDVQPLSAADTAPATVEITLPRNTKVYVDDLLIRSTSGTQRMETPPLERGKNYSYTFRIEIERDGKTATFVRKISVQAGQTAKADFTELAKKDAPDKPAPDKPKTEKPAEEFKISAVERDIIDRTNAERKKNDLPELKPNEQLFAAAHKHSENMARLEKMSHDLDGKSPSDRVKETGYRGGYIGENVAYGYRGAKDVVDGWMKSEGHRENILNGNYTEIGIGVAKSGNGLLYYTQVFARPAK